MTASATKCRVILGQFTYLGRVATFISLSDAHSIDLGASFAPIRRRSQSRRRRIGIWPVWTLRTVMSRPARPTVVSSGVRRCSSIENRPVGGFPTDPTIPSPVVFERNNAWGLYTYLEARLSRRLYPGFLFDYAQALDVGVGDTKPTRRTLRSGSQSSSVCGCNIPILPSRVPNSSQPMRTRSSCNGQSSLGAMHSFRDR